jgi:hypothetical protein
MIFARVLSVLPLIAGGHFIRDVVGPNDQRRAPDVAGMDSLELKTD